VALVSATDDALQATFHRLAEAHRRLDGRLGAAMEARCRIPLAWFEVLSHLGGSDDGQLTMGELAERLGLTTGGVTRLVDRIESAGLVSRRPSSTDRRVAYAVISRVGRAKLRQASGVHAENLRAVFADFSERELAVLDRLLGRLRAADDG
jgi:DNA-binding MarR family transcriptional regulator